MSHKEILAIPPGETICELLADRNISEYEFMVKMGMSKDQLDCLLNGNLPLSSDVAKQLEEALGIPATFWCNLESIYRRKLADV